MLEKSRQIRIDEHMALSIALTETQAKLEECVQAGMEVEQKLASARNRLAMSAPVPPPAVQSGPLDALACVRDLSAMLPPELASSFSQCLSYLAMASQPIAKP